MLQHFQILNMIKVNASALIGQKLVKETKIRKFKQIYFEQFLNNVNRINRNNYIFNNATFLSILSENKYQFTQPSIHSCVTSGSELQVCRLRTARAVKSCEMHVRLVSLCLP